MFKSHSICSACGRRWRYHKDLCRSCAQAAGVPGALLSTRAREAEKIKALEARLATVTRVVPSTLTRTVLIDGVEYDVIFDGSVR